MMRVSLAAAAMAAALAWCPALAQAQRDRPAPDERSIYDDRRGPGGWERIGEIVVRPRVERETIAVNVREGRLSRIGLRVSDSDIEVIELTVRYGNGESERIPVGKLMRAGSVLPPIDLRGGARRLRDIEVTYRPYGPARLELVGDPGRPGGPVARWEELGCQRVGFLEDKDIIRVGRKEGQFRAIKLSVKGNKVRLVRLRIVYANGQVDELPVRTVIPEGTETRPIDLSGRNRGIDRIELFYLPQINFGGRANVCAYGQ